jgi:hypothetical protein
MLAGIGRLVGGIGRPNGVDLLVPKPVTLAGLRSALSTVAAPADERTPDADGATSAA